MVDCFKERGAQCGWQCGTTALTSWKSWIYFSTMCAPFHTKGICVIGRWGKISHGGLTWAHQLLLSRLQDREVCYSPVFSSGWPNRWNIPLHCGSGIGLYHIVLRRASAMSPDGGETAGIYQRKGSAHRGLTPSPHGRDMTAFSENLWLKKSKW